MNTLCEVDDCPTPDLCRAIGCQAIYARKAAEAEAAAGDPWHQRCHRSAHHARQYLADVSHQPIDERLMRMQSARRLLKLGA